MQSGHNRCKASVCRRHEASGRLCRVLSEHYVPSRKYHAAGPVHREHDLRSGSRGRWNTVVRLKWRYFLPGHWNVLQRDAHNHRTILQSADWASRLFCRVHMAVPSGIKWRKVRYHFSEVRRWARYKKQSLFHWRYRSHSEGHGSSLWRNDMHGFLFPSSVLHRL